MATTGPSDAFSELLSMSSLWKNRASRQPGSDMSVSVAGHTATAASTLGASVKTDDMSAFPQSGATTYQWEGIPPQLASAVPADRRDTLTICDDDNDGEEDMMTHAAGQVDDHAADVSVSPATATTLQQVDAASSTGYDHACSCSTPLVWTHNFHLSVSGVSCCSRRPALSSVVTSAVHAAAQAAAQAVAVCSSAAADKDNHDRVINTCVRPMHLSGGTCFAGDCDFTAPRPRQSLAGAPCMRRPLAAAAAVADCRLPPPKAVVSRVCGSGASVSSVRLASAGFRSSCDPSRTADGSVDGHRRPNRNDGHRRRPRPEQLLRTCGWYYGDMSWQQAFGWLRASGAGTFLARDSSDRSASFALSVQTRCGPTSIRVYVHSDRRLALDAPAALSAAMPRFDSLPALVDHYGRHGRSMVLTVADRPLMAVRLTRPLLLRPPSLRHLARLAVNSQRGPARRASAVPEHVRRYLDEYSFCW